MIEQHEQDKIYWQIIKKLFYNLPVYFVLCNCSVLSVVSVKNENYNNKKIKKPKKTNK